MARHTDGTAATAIGYRRFRLEPSKTSNFSEARTWQCARHTTCTGKQSKLTLSAVSRTKSPSSSESASVHMRALHCDQTARLLLLLQRPTSGSRHGFCRGYRLSVGRPAQAWTTASSSVLKPTTETKMLRTHRKRLLVCPCPCRFARRPQPGDTRHSCKSPGTRQQHKEPEQPAPLGCSRGFQNLRTYPSRQHHDIIDSTQSYTSPNKSPSAFSWS